MVTDSFVHALGTRAYPTILLFIVAVSFGRQPAVGGRFLQAGLRFPDIASEGRSRCPTGPAAADFSRGGPVSVVRGRPRWDICPFFVVNSVPPGAARGSARLRLRSEGSC